MQILRKRLAKREWWVGQIIDCPCGAKLQLEEFDVVRQYQDPAGTGIVFDCPECKKPVCMNRQTLG